MKNINKELLCNCMAAPAPKSRVLQTKELAEVEEALKAATCPPSLTGSEQATHTSVEAPQPVPQPRQQELQKQLGGKGYFVHQQPQQHTHHHPVTGTQNTAHALGSKMQAPLNRNWAAKPPVPASRMSWPPSNATVAPPNVHQHQPAACPPAYTVEEPDSDDSPVGEVLEAEKDAPNANAHSTFPSTLQSSFHVAEVTPPTSGWGSGSAGAQDNATHVLMRKVECKRNSNGVSTAPKLRVREVYTRIEPSGERQTMAAERHAPSEYCCSASLPVMQIDVHKCLHSPPKVGVECKHMRCLCRVMQANNDVCGYQSSQTAAPEHRPMQRSNVSPGMNIMPSSCDREKVRAPTPTPPSQAFMASRAASINGNSLLQP